MDSTHIADTRGREQEGESSETTHLAKGDHVIVEQLSPQTVLPLSINTTINTGTNDSQLLCILSQSSTSVSTDTAVTLPNNLLTVNTGNGFSEHETSAAAAGNGFSAYKVSVLTAKRAMLNKKSAERRVRVTFSSNQTAALEKAFQEKQYLSSEDRIQLAKGLGIQENQVKVWFQNRRTKSRRSAWRKKPSDETFSVEGKKM